MISAPALLRDLKRLTATLEADLHGRIAATVTQAASISLNRSLLETQFREPAQ